ncbi:MAG: hypothetical protein QG657_2302 [Acidobacteriota bacterium]|nr:hypothetical protein [Acidobacteriota bacterium]
MIHAGFSELKRAFLVHSSASVDKDSISYNLLLFYAVESGLKSIYLRWNNIPTTEKIVDEKLTKSHNLSEWVQKLYLPASVSGKCPGFKLARDNKHYDVSQVHQAWRYGIEIDDPDQQELVRWLETVRNLIKEHI